jgi:type IV pilus assembly protein PilV
MMQRRQQSGVALIEALIAIVILAIGLLGTIGLQARAYSAMNDASMRAEATIASEKLFGLMSTDVNNLAAYALAPGGTAGTALQKWATETQATIKNAAISVTVTPASNGTDSTAVTVKIAWTRKAGGPTNTNTMTAYMSGST